jgi:hypothetical protein
MNYRVVIDIEVEDPETLYMAAMHHATSWDGMDRVDAQDLLRPDPEEVCDVGACLIMLLDPGQSPAGTSIIESYTEGP